MDQLLNSIKSSDLINALNDVQTKNPFEYKFDEDNVPLGAKYFKKVEPLVKGLGALGDEIVFEVPKFGFLNWGVLELTLTTALDETLIKPNFGVNAWEWIELRAKEKVIQRIYADYILIRMNEMSEDMLTRFNVITNPTNTLSIGATGTVYCPLFFACFDREQDNFNTDFIEDLTIVCKLKSSYTDMGLTGAWASMSNKLYLDYTKLSQTHLQSGFNTLSYKADLYKDIVLPTGSTSYEFYLDSDKDIFAMHLYLKKSTEYFNISNVKMIINNEVFFDKTSQLNAIRGWNTDNINNFHNTGKFVFSHWFSMRNDRHRNNLTINGKTSTILFQLEYPSTVAGTSLRVFFEHFTINSINDYGLISNQ